MQRAGESSRRTPGSQHEFAGSGSNAFVVGPFGDLRRGDVSESRACVGVGRDVGPRCPCWRWSGAGGGELKQKC
eukprot:5571588-Pleurochrysis_carterae.AAC.1